MRNNYFFVDGASLLGDVQRLKKKNNQFYNSQLDLNKIVKYFSGIDLFNFHLGYFRRFVFYFVQNDERLNSMVILPQCTQPSIIGDIRIEYCGKKISQFEKAREWLEKADAPQHVRECLYRAEKAVDTQICCDALQLAATGKLDRLFLYTNDYDFAPLCRVLRQLGANISLFRLIQDDVNKELASECDSFHVINGDSELAQCFKAK